VPSASTLHGARGVREPRAVDVVPGAKHFVRRTRGEGTPGDVDRGGRTYFLTPPSSYGRMKKREGLFRRRARRSFRSI
jgi:hypothetical protein